MAIKINFDAANIPESPTIILANRNGNKLGMIKAKQITVKDCLNDAAEISFEVTKFTDGTKEPLWEKIKDFKLVWCKEWDTWFEIYIDLTHSTEVKKSVRGIRLGVAELSQLMLYNIEINTENDIARDDYVIPTVFYQEEHPEASLLHRITEKAPHYSITHVDASLADIQRTFTFDGVSVYDAFQTIAEEINAIFILKSNSNADGKIRRTIEVYDLSSNCRCCEYRGEFTGACPECGSDDIKTGYGNDTTIFITADELSDDIQFSSDTDSIKNCFKLEGGDDLMTATIRNCNPNGTDYIWRLSEDMAEDMPEELTAGITSYNNLYDYYRNQYIATINTDKLAEYNALVKKYQKFNADLEEIPQSMTGYPALMTAYYNTIDFVVFLQSALMPDVHMNDTNASEQAALLTRANLSPVAVTNIDSASLPTADNAVLGMAKAVLNSGYQVKVKTSALDNRVWTGNFVVTNYSDAEDTAVSNTVIVDLCDSREDYETFVRQKVDKALAKEKVDNLSITGLFQMDYDDFRAELTKYCLDSLTGFLNACQSCIDILIEQGVADSQTWAGSDPNLYDDLYLPYYRKQQALEQEIAVRQREIAVILGTYRDDELVTEGLQTYILELKNEIQDSLNFENYLGPDLWTEFCAYRREDKYTNSNYISDGLNNAQLFDRALEFIKTANEEIYKSSELQHSISTTLKNLLVMKKFQPIVDYFEVGNWLRIQVDETVYKLRLLEYEIDYDNLEHISVVFSDVMKIANGMSDAESILSQAKSMATSYDSVKRQAGLAENSSSVLKNWSTNGLDATNTKIIGGADHQSIVLDEHGLLCRRYNAITDSYDDIQLKFVNSTMAITDDNWETVKTAVGLYYYYDPVTGELKQAYGINGEVIIGRLLLGEQLGIYAEDNSLTFDRNGLMITNGTNAFAVNPNSDILLALSNKQENILYVDKNGGLHATGTIVATSGTFTGTVNASSGTIAGWSITGSRIEKDNTSDDGYRCGIQNTTSASGAVFFAGCNTASGGSIASSSASNFYVTQAGYLYCNNAHIEGSITATSGSISGSLITSGINAANITTGTLNADRIAANSITATKLNITSLSSVSANLGTVTAGILRSTNYVSGSTGMQLNLATGAWDSQYFKLSSTGEVTATSGAIGGWSINNNYIQREWTEESDSFGFRLGATTADSFVFYLYQKPKTSGASNIHNVYMNKSGATYIKTLTCDTLRYNTLVPGSSSIRYKTNIVPMDESVANRLEDIQIVGFDYKPEHGSKGQYGVIAEQVESIHPVAVIYNEKGQPDAVDYIKFIPLLIKKIQMQQKEIDYLKTIK